MKGKKENPSRWIIHITFDDDHNYYTSIGHAPFQDLKSPEEAYSDPLRCTQSKNILKASSAGSFFNKWRLMLNI